MIGGKFVGLRCKNGEIYFCNLLHGFDGTDNGSIQILEPLVFLAGVLLIEFLHNFTSGQVLGMLPKFLY